jgi:hypothetical protein
MSFPMDTDLRISLAMGAQDGGGIITQVSQGIDDTVRSQGC